MQPEKPKLDYTAVPGTDEERKGKLGQSNKVLRIWRSVAVLFIILSIALVIALIVLAIKPTKTIEEKAEKCDDIPSPSLQITSNPRGNELYRGLSEKEIQQVREFMIKSELNIVPVQDANLSTNYIYSVEDYLPDKKDAVEYLDDVTKSPPTRKARVIVFNGASKPKEVLEYLVWPIPDPTQKKRAYLNRPDNKELTWKSRPVDTTELKRLLAYIQEELSPLKQLMMDSFGQHIDVLNCNENCMHLNVAPRSVPTLGDRYLILWAFLNEKSRADYYLYPLDFYIVVTTPGNGDRFQVLKIYYNKAAYNSVTELKDKYDRGEITRSNLPSLKDREALYGSPKYSKQGETLDQTRRPPEQYMPDGKRFTMNGQYVEYLKWSFNLHQRTLTGVQLFDVRFDGDRIAYEISMQDILVLYAGEQPDNYFKNYFDTGWSIARFNRPLIKGVDCPVDAYYIVSTAYDVGEDRITTNKDGICIFEHRNSVPIRHHYSSDFFSGSYRFAFSMPDSVLIVRQILTLWNYDYIFDYEFHQNGIVEAKVSSTGYVAVTVNVNDGKYGYVIDRDNNATANLHQHLFNFKFDIDVAGSKNRFKTLDVGYENLKNPFLQTQKWSQMKMSESLKSNEARAQIQYNFSDPKYYVFYNFYKNTRGLSKAFRLHANGFSKVVLPDQHPIMRKGAAWAKNQITVTKHKEKERTTASHFVQGDPYEPDIDFSSFTADNDDLVDEDLVAWVTVGLHHIPSLEDLPVTTTPGKTISVALVPFNYFDRDPSIHSRDAAVFWNERWNPKNDYLHKDDTCIPENRNPHLS